MPFLTGRNHHSFGCDKITANEFRSKLHQLDSDLRQKSTETMEKNSPTERFFVRPVGTRTDWHTPSARMGHEGYFAFERFGRCRILRLHKRENNGAGDYDVLFRTDPKQVRIPSNPEWDGHVSKLKGPDGKIW